MTLDIKRFLKTKRAPRGKDRIGGSYTPSGIDIFTTDDLELISFDKYGTKDKIRIEDLLSVLDELDFYENRRHLPGEEIEIYLKIVRDEDKKGDVYHCPSFMIAKPHEEYKGLICLDVFSGYGLRCITLTAERDSLRTALGNLLSIRELEQIDRERYAKVD